jgi:hypothetical protein
MIETPKRARGKTKLMPTAIKKALAEANLTSKLDEEALLANPLQENDRVAIHQFCLTQVTGSNDAWDDKEKSSDNDNVIMVDLPDPNLTPQSTGDGTAKHDETADEEYEDELVDYELSPDLGGLGLA